MLTLFPQTQNDVPIITFLSDDEAKKLSLQNLQTLCKNYDTAAENLLHFQLSYDEFAFFRHQQKLFPAARIDHTNAKRMSQIVQWYAQAQYYLSIKEHREDWLKQSKNKSFFNTLTNWQTHEALADYSASALVALQHHLNEMNHCLNKALLELHQSWRKSFYQPFKMHLSKQQYVSAQHALVRELKQHQLRQHILLNAMVMRLQTASLVHDVSCDDILWHTFTSAKQQGKLPGNFMLPHKPRHGLDKISFFFFHQNILERGTPSQKTALFKCEWYQSNSNDAIPMQQTKNEMFPIPSDLKYVLPPKLQSELFYQVAIINGLFKRAQDGLHTSINLQVSITHPLLKNLGECEENIRKLSKQLQNEIKAGFRALTHWKQNRAIHQFQQQLTQVISDKIANVYLNFVERLLSQLQMIIETKQTFTQQEATRVMSLLITLDPYLNMTRCHAAYKTIEKEIYQTLEKIEQIQKFEKSENLFTQGLVLFEQGQFEQAMHLWQDALTHYPHNQKVASYCHLLNVQMQYEQAQIKQFAIPSAHQLAWQKRMNVLSDNQQTRAAHRCLEQLLQLEPENQHYAKQKEKLAQTPSKTSSIVLSIPTSSCRWFKSSKATIDSSVTPTVTPMMT